MTLFEYLDNALAEQERTRRLKVDAGQEQMKRVKFNAALTLIAVRREMARRKKAGTWHVATRPSATDTEDNT